MKKLTRQQAINEFCKGCIYDPLDKGNWKQQVTACTMSDCQLYPYRPKSKPKKGYVPKAQRTDANIDTNEG